MACTTPSPVKAVTFPSRQISRTGAEVVFSLGGDTWEKHTNSKQVRGRSLVVIFHWGDVMIVQAGGDGKCSSSTPSPIGSFLLDCSSRPTGEPQWGTTVARPQLFYLKQQKPCLILDFRSHNIIFLQFLQWIQWLNTTRTVHCHMCAIKAIIWLSHILKQDKTTTV